MDAEVQRQSAAPADCADQGQAANDTQATGPYLSPAATPPAAADLAGLARALAEPLDVPRRGRYALDGDVPPKPGGMGQVWLAHDDRLGRKVGLKEPRADMDSEAARRLFLAEAQITGQLQHPGIVPVYDLVRPEDGSPPFYTMRYVDGQTLAEAAAGFHQARARGAAGNVELRELLTAFVSLCQTLEYAHAHGVVHRDLKGSNVILGRYGEVVVLDWGVAKVVGGPDDPVTEAITVDVECDPTHGGKGTLAYMAPEQAQQPPGVIDRRTDVFGLGATLYQVLTGHAPYEGKDRSELLERVREGQVQPVQQRAGWKVPRALAAVCEKALAARPENRYQTAAELADEVKRWLSGEPTRAWPEPLGVRAGRWARKNRVLAGSTMAAAVMALVLGTAGGVYWQQQRGRARGQVEAGLAQAADLRRQYRWKDAQAMLEQVRGWAEQAAYAGLRQRLAEAKADLALAWDLDKVRLEGATLVDGKWDPGGVRDEYPIVFARHELDVLNGDLDELAGCMRGRAVRERIVAALDDWAPQEADVARRQRLLGLANSVDEPDPWRQGARRAVAARDGAAVRRLVGSVGGGRPTPGVVLLLALELPRESEEATRLLRQARLQQPGDFWLSFALGNFHSKQRDYQQAAECYLLAAALRPDSSAVHNNLGIAHYEQKDLKEAIACYRTAIAIDPRLAQAHVNLGNALCANKDLEEAIACYRTAITIDPKNPKAHSNLGVALHDNKELEAAIAAHHRAIALDPMDAAAHSNVGIALHANGDPKGAIDFCRRAIAIDPKNADAHCNLGYLLSDLKRPEEAEASYRLALKHRPDHADAHHNLGNLLRDLKRPEEAEASYRLALQHRPGHAGAHNNLGNLLARLGRHKEAEASYQMALKHQPDYAEAHTNLGVLLADLRRPAEAEAAFRLAIQHRPDHAGAHTNLGVFLARLGRHKEAEASYQMALKHQPDLAEAHYALGNLMGRLGRPEKAEASYRLALKHRPDHADAHYNLGNLMGRLGRPEKAEASYRLALKHRPDHADAHLNLGNLLRDLKRPEEAEASYRLALQHRPDHAGAHTNLGVFLARLGRHKEAEASYQMALKHQPDLAEVHYNLGVVLRDQGSSAMPSPR
jgi:eukaryotic-like serine/threonine-protein kinase